MTTEEQAKYDELDQVLLGELIGESYDESQENAYLKMMHVVATELVEIKSRQAERKATITRLRRLMRQLEEGPFPF